MAGIIASGAGSGLDISSIISQLVEAEAAPKQFLLDSKEVSLQTELSAVGSLNSALTEFQSALTGLKDTDSFNSRIAVSEATSVFSAVAESTAIETSYEVEVVRLAQAHKLSSDFFTDSSTVVGTGTLDIEVGGSSFSIAIDSDNDELGEIRDAINNASNNTGVSASIISADGGSKLILTSDKTGVSEAIKVTVTDDDGNHTDTNGLSQLVYDVSGGTTNLAEIDAAIDAQIKIDGQTVTSSSNIFKDVITGVDITAVSVSETVGETKTLSVSTNTGSISSLVEGFVDKYNTYMDSLRGLSSFDSETGVAGPLLGDASLFAVENQIKRELSSTSSDFTKKLKSLVDFGITTTSTGDLSIDNTKLQAALKDAPDELADFFADQSTGLAIRIDNVIANYVDSTTGSLSSRTTSLQDRIDDISDDRLELNRDLFEYETRLREEFGALDILLSQLQATGTYLTEQFANLPGFTKSSG